MSSQYLRRASLVAAANDGSGLDLSALQFKFEVRRGDMQTPNSVDLRIYNVSDDTAKRFLVGPDGTAEFTSVMLSAGYQDSSQYGLIFQGTIMQTRRGRESAADTYLDIRAADGDEAYNFAVINTSLAAGSSPDDHAAAVAKAMSLPVGYVPPLPQTQLPRGKVFYGMGRDAMREVAKNSDASWSIQDGQLQLTPLTQFVPGEITVITSATGMINWPEQTPNGIHIRCLLNPNIKIGCVVKIDNKSVQTYLLPLGIGNAAANGMVPRLDWDGYYVVYVAEHSGDTRGQQWYTDMTCLGTDGTVIPQYIVGNRRAISPPPGVKVIS